MKSIKGRVGGNFRGYDIDMQLTAESVKGRIGGKIQGGNLEMQITLAAISGRVGTRIFGHAINLARTETGLTGNIGKMYQVEMQQAGNVFSGWMGHPLLPRDIDLIWDSGKLSGRIGQDIFGKDLYLEGDTHLDPTVLAAVACASFMWFIETAPKGVR